jgi:hypothetical protein
MQGEGAGAAAAAIGAVKNSASDSKDMLLLFCDRK